MSVAFTETEIKEAARKPSAMVKESSVVVCDVASLDGSGERDVDIATLRAVANLVFNANNNSRETTILVLIAAGATECTLFAHVPSKYTLTARLLIDACIAEKLRSCAEDNSCDFACAAICDCPLKEKDVMMGRAFACLRRHGAMLDEDDSSDDTMPKLWDL